MNWINIAWPMIAGACLTLGLINLYIGLDHPPRAALLLFSLSAVAVACVAGFELALMHADSPARYLDLMRGLDVAAGVTLASLIAFIWVFFGSGNKWLALAGPGLYAVALVFDFLPGSSLGYLAIMRLKTLKTFGATYKVAEGVPNPWNMVTYVGVLMMLVFVMDASARLWRCGARRRAVVVGGGVTLFLLAAGTHSALVEAGLVRSPYLVSWAYLAILAAMSSELNSDVLAAAQLSHQLQESERSMDLAGAAAGLGMWTWDVVRDTTWATSRTRALFDFPAMGSVNLARFIGALHPEDREAVRNAIDDSLTTGGDYEVEYRVPLPDGQIRWLASRGRVEHNAGGRPILMRGVVLDISALRHSELELQQLQGQLAHVGRVSMLGQLASAIAHELSQPLGAILRNAEAAELFLQHDAPDLDELRAILADIRKDDQRASDVIERLCVLLKRRSIAPRLLAVGELLANVAALMRVDSSTRHIKLKIKAADGLPMVMADSVHVQQVLLNLVLNAMDAAEGAPPAVERWVEVRAKRHGERAVEVAVSDSGPGIPPENIGLVFEPFFTTKDNGMGIGLPISRTIVEAHGGRIWAENNAERGATLRFTLPLADETIEP